MSQDRVNQLEYLLMKRNQTIEKLDSELSATKDNLRVANAELAPLKAEKSRAYDRHVLSTGEPCCDSKNIVQGIEDERASYQTALETILKIKPLHPDVHQAAGYNTILQVCQCIAADALGGDS